jgi:aspartate/glutamate racemase
VTERDATEIYLNALLKGEEAIPQSVRRCAERLRDLGIWRRFSRNSPATSCQVAARKRNRLGHQGIPLWDELKSFLGEYNDARGRRVFLAHCRGDRKLDEGKLHQALQFAGQIRRLSIKMEDRLWAEYRVGFGTVNPFTDVPDVSDVVQLFDCELDHPVGVPGTVMTNAGDFTWAVEFDPAELVAKLSGAQWADIIQPETEAEDPTLWGARDPETIGILTGNPSDSGLELCGAVNRHVRRLLRGNSLGDVSMPKVIISCTPEIGISMEMDCCEKPLRHAVLRGVDELCAAGAKILAHPAHTTHYFAPEIAARALEKGARFISMADLTAARVVSMGIREIALLGTKYVTDFGEPWSVYKGLFPGITVHTPSPAGWKKIRDLGYAVQQEGLTSLSFNWMRDLLRDEVPASCEHVVLAMTELSALMRQLKSRGRQSKVLIDPVDIYGQAIPASTLAYPP